MVPTTSSTSVCEAMFLLSTVRYLSAPFTANTNKNKAIMLLIEKLLVFMARSPLERFVLELAAPFYGFPY
jgi:hypothetical protein